MVVALTAAFGCGDDDGGAGSDAGVDAPADPNFVANCVYTNTFADSLECREYRGAGWNPESAEFDCSRVFLRMAGELTVGSPCAVPDEIGRCVVGNLEEDGYVVISTGDPSACGGALTGCETFAGGTFFPDPSCNSCAATGAEESGAIVPTSMDCRDPLPGEPPGLSDGQVCTNVLISGSTEPGRRFTDYGNCDVVRTQRPYYSMATPIDVDPDDPRLSDDDYMAELLWVREQAEASACICCHTDSGTPSGAAIWNTEAGDLWIDTVSDDALAMFGGFTDSAGFGFFDPAENNGFDRSETGLPSTDVPRLRAFVERELTRRGISLEEARTLPPFAPQFRELIEFEPEACDEGIGIDADGTLRWTGGAARYVWVIEEGGGSPGVPPNWDLPEGTLWALRVDADSAPMSCGMSYGEVGPTMIQRVPEDGSAPPELVSGETYYLAVMRDLAQPITRCLFTAP